MNRLDLIIDALESAHNTNDTGVLGLTKLRHDVALAAARELRALEPVAWAATSEDGAVEAIGYSESRRFDTPLYALEVTK